MGMLVGILVLVAIGAVVAAILLTRHHHKAAAATTVVVTTQAAPVTTATQPVVSAVPIPNLIGQSEADAAAALKGQGFVVRVLTVRGAPPSGGVIGESPAPGQQADPKSIVTLKISNGAAVPAATTTPSAPATTVTTTVPATTPAPSATTTTAPAATTTTPPTTTATPPAQPSSAPVPDVTGGDVQAASQSLSRSNLLTSIQYVPGSDPLGTVEDSSPASGATAPTGSHVTINASSGPGQKTEENVPDVAGKTIPQAVAAMQQAGLRLIFVKKTVTDRSLAGTVVEQTPAAGKTAPKNAQVLVYMGAFK
ncbi:MAG TPA: PASTA domain-containing protein [Gaiellaceae bacterium]